MTKLSVPSSLVDWLREAARRNIRLPVVWQGAEQPLLVATYQLIGQHFATEQHKIYWLGAAAPPAATEVSSSGRQLLGSECDVLVINAFSGFPADSVAATAGCVKAGGLWLLICPPLLRWQQQTNPAHANLLPYPLDAKQHHGQFLQFWCAQLQRSNIMLLRDNTVERPLQWPDQPEQHPVAGRHQSINAEHALLRHCCTRDQRLAVDAIIKVVSGHRRRPLVLTADRGRGKSAALGIAAALLSNSGSKPLTITAPSPLAAKVALLHFQQIVPSEQQQNLQFVPIDILLSEMPETALLMIDEAAALPTRQLQLLTEHYSRVVFATTEHGYEGTGRGFQLRFVKYLQQHAPGWRQLVLEQPIRYQQHDPLEQLIFRSFLLSTVSELAPLAPQQSTPLQVQHYQSSDWLHHTEMLHQVFSLLSLSHYQTQVKDLAALLENPALQVVTLEQGGKLLACALLTYEGSLSDDLAQQVYQGSRRLQGHLLAQSLAFHLARPQLATQRLLRIMRIAVQPHLQRQQLGSTLLRYIVDYSQRENIDYLGTSFGLTAELLAFWRQHHFAVVRLGIGIDKSSNEYSALLLLAIKGDPAVTRQLSAEFSTQLYKLLPEHYALLDIDLALTLASPEIGILSPAQQQQLLLFAKGQRPYELVNLLLLNWFNIHYRQLNSNAASLFCARLWLKQDWSTLAKRFNFSGKKQVIHAMQRYLLLSGTVTG